ncbi:hypothetical protein SODALDRAFT_316121 [Sodiomyces alkalinus F11]|uniref:P-loop containing nucleoside triphosphate hydrolase protein n=1 Tax=Sodiomyces alkalinus (strain CBS 110278 / VKM F-3762 / F11) TaxID=1314773 RepID=A0A3N2PMZ3_SODAK|nr:hypothetical protein SODALDRAFT_316121 [Sodiomyces alkalinus F11]ROT35901.1 hypothetical protein SODALDRAFT_316121 [Sodiomyces alkalinus F11]
MAIGSMSSSKKPIFCATHPRACSTAFERVFMTRRDELCSVHEPFGDSYYYGPERISPRYDNEPETREKTGFGNTTYADILKSIEDASDGGSKRVFIKDMAYYLFPLEGQPARIVPSLSTYSAANQANNPTVIPIDVLRRFQFTFLIRHPRRAVPSYYRCCVPPLNEVTGFIFDPKEAGYSELRRLLDFFVREGLVDRSDIVVVDADDLLDRPEPVVRAYCERVGLEFTDSMLNWSEEDTAFAVEQFAKWEGFHNDALSSSSLKPRSHAAVSKTVTKESEDEEWTEKYGEEGAKIIRETVDANVADYEYLKRFALQV